MTRKAILVYQTGIANVFEVASFNMADYGRDAKQLLQHTFESCEWFARGLTTAGWQVATAQCNQAGDIAHARWSTELDDAPYYRKFHPVWNKVAP